jgi:hypothetical protein
MKRHRYAAKISQVCEKPVYRMTEGSHAGGDNIYNVGVVLEQVCQSESSIASSSVAPGAFSCWLFGESGCCLPHGDRWKGCAHCAG